MGKKNFLIAGFITMLLPVFAQTGGDNVYEFLNLTHSGLISSLGGTNVSLYDDNLNFTYHNPSLLNERMDRTLALNYSNYYADINYGLALYSWSLDRKSNLAGGITYLNYGSFIEANNSGEKTGNFTSSEYAFSIIYSKQIDSLLTVGINFKPVLSHLEKYTSFGIAFDIGASWHNQSNLFSAGMVLKNIGYQLTTYYGEPREKLPFEIQAGFSQNLAHSPFRFSLTLRHLEKFDLTHLYEEPSETTNIESSSSDFFENLMRHAIIGAELIPHKNFYFSAGYNYQRRKELQIESNVSTVGLSWGFGINTSLLNIEFGRATYHIAGSTTHISLIVKTDHIYSRYRN